MTTLLTTYSFMDLLKDYNYVPETNHSENKFLSELQGAFNRATNLLKLTTTGYDFMDLLNDKGYVPQIVEDEASILDKLENTYNNVVELVEDNIIEYDFMDLLNDKGYVPANTSTPLFAANDNFVEEKAA